MSGVKVSGVKYPETPAYNCAYCKCIIFAGRPLATIIILYSCLELGFFGDILIMSKFSDLEHVAKSIKPYTPRSFEMSIKYFKYGYYAT